MLRARQGERSLRRSHSPFSGKNWTKSPRFLKLPGNAIIIVFFECCRNQAAKVERLETEMAAIRSRIVQLVDQRVQRWQRRKRILSPTFRGTGISPASKQGNSKARRRLHTLPHAYSLNARGAASANYWRCHFSCRRQQRSQLGTGLHSNKGVNLGQDCTPTKESTWDRIALQRRSQLGTGLHSNKGVNLGQDCPPTIPYSPLHNVLCYRTRTYLKNTIMSWQQYI